MFISYVWDCWNAYPTIGGMRGLCAKLKLLRKDISKLNKEVFGNIFHRISFAGHRVRGAEEAFDLESDVLLCCSI